MCTCLISFTLANVFNILPLLAQGSPPNSTPCKTVPVLLSLRPSLIFPFHLSPCQVHPTRLSFYIFSGFLAIFILLSSNHNRMSLVASQSIGKDMLEKMFLCWISCFFVNKRFLSFFQTKVKGEGVDVSMLRPLLHGNKFNSLLIKTDKNEKFVEPDKISKLVGFLNDSSLLDSIPNQMS